MKFALLAAGGNVDTFEVGDFAPCHPQCFGTIRPKWKGQDAYDLCWWHNAVAFWNWPDFGTVRRITERETDVAFALAIETVPSAETTIAQRRLLNWLNQFRYREGGELVNVYEGQARSPSYAVDVSQIDPDDLVVHVREVWYGPPTHIFLDNAAQLRPYFGSAKNPPPMQSEVVYQKAMRDIIRALSRIAPVIGNTNGSMLHQDLIAYRYEEHPTDDIALGQAIIYDSFPVLRNQPRTRWPIPAGRRGGVMCTRSGGVACKSGLP